MSEIWKIAVFTRVSASEWTLMPRNAAIFSYCEIFLAAYTNRRTVAPSHRRTVAPSHRRTVALSSPSVLSHKIALSAPAQLLLSLGPHAGIGNSLS